MANVTEDMLQRMAVDIVAKTKQASEASPSLTALTKEAIESNGFNRDQGSRLVERVNATAFLDGFPTKIAFEVADPYVIFGESNPASETMSKTASFSNTGSTFSASRYSKNFEDYLFDGNVKTASELPSYGTLTSKDEMIAYWENKKQEDAIHREKIASQYAVEDSMADLWGMFKQAALRGTPTDKLETEIMFAIPQDFGFSNALVETMVHKLASETDYNQRMIKRANLAELDTERIRLDTPISIKAKEIYSYASKN